MILKDVYNQLANKSLSLADYNNIIAFKNQSRVEMKQEFTYLADVLLIDLYINENLLDDALNVATKAISTIDTLTFKNIYISILERLIYIYIQKKNFKSAYRYAFMKRNHIDVENLDDINRWYLEMAYIYAELDQKDKALLNLKAIMNNYPNDSLKALTLSNMTKLYIDQKQKEDAKESLNECISLVYKLNDEEGILYCYYLNAKLYILEKNHRLARQSFQDFFKNLGTVDPNYLHIVNEYVSLLIDMNLFDEAYRLSAKHLNSIEKSPNLELKKYYYTNYLKIYILKNKTIREDVRQLLDAIDILQEQISRQDFVIESESSEDEKKIEIDDKLNKLIQRMEKTINITLIGLDYDSVRNILMNYSRQLERQINFEEATYIIFPLESLDFLNDVNFDFDNFSAYNFKKDRLYEKTLSYDRIKGSVVEMAINQNQDVALDLSSFHFDIKDVNTGEIYSKTNIKSVIAIPLFNKNELYGCAIYTSKDKLAITNDYLINYKMATKLLEVKLLNVFYEENIRALKQINKNINNHLATGTFYYNIKTQTFTLSNNLKKFLSLNTDQITYNNFEKLVKKEDLILRKKIIAHLENVEEYKCDYHLKINHNDFYVSESAYPYISKEGIVKFYFGVITVLKDSNEIKRQMFRKYEMEDFNRDFALISEKSKSLNYNCNFVRFRIDIANEINYNIHEKIREHVYSQIQRELTPKTYYLTGGDFISIAEGITPKAVKDIVFKMLSEFAEGYEIGELKYDFDVKSSLVRFPADTYNINEVLDFSLLTLDKKEKYRVFDESIRKEYLKKKNVTTCITEHLNKKSIELLYQPLKSKNHVSGYLVNYNVNGLEMNFPIENILDSTVYIAFEKLIFDTLVDELIKPLENKVYLKLSLETIEVFLNIKYFSKKLKNKYQAIVIWITNHNQNIQDTIKRLEAYGFDVVLSLDSFKSLSTEAVLSSKNIKGVATDLDLKNQFEYVDLFKILNLELITKQKLLDYFKIKVIEDTYLKYSRLL